jgi:hypothetical protein
MLLSQKAAEAEQEITRLRLGAMKVMSGILTAMNPFHPVLHLCVFLVGMYESQSLRVK